jgi:hypothetical protein
MARLVAAAGGEAPVAGDSIIEADYAEPGRSDIDHDRLLDVLSDLETAKARLDGLLGRDK